MLAATPPAIKRNNFLNGEEIRERRQDELVSAMTLEGRLVLWRLAGSPFEALEIERVGEFAMGISMP